LILNESLKQLSASDFIKDFSWLGNEESKESNPNLWQEEFVSTLVA
jgi:hypothetical protein